MPKLIQHVRMVTHAECGHTRPVQVLDGQPMTPITVPGLCEECDLDLADRRSED